MENDNKNPKGREEEIIDDIFNVNSDSISGLNAEEIDVDVENIDAVGEPQDIFNLARIIIKAIVIAKERHVLPSEFEKSTERPEDIASLATQGAVIIDTLIKLATGEINTWEKLANRFIDWSHVIALSSIEFLADRALPFIEKAAVTAVEFVGQYFQQPGWGQYIEQIFEAYRPEIANGFKAVCVAAFNKIHQWRKKLINYIFNQVRIKRNLPTKPKSLRESKMESEELGEFEDIEEYEDENKNK